MKRNFTVFETLLFFVLITGSFLSFKGLQYDMPWTQDQLMDPATLAKAINNPKARKPEILNVGPMEKIQGAKEMGMGSTQEGIEKFKAYVDQLPLDREIVIYCGCCKLVNCPNIKKTFLYLDARGYTHAKILNLETSLDEDWVKKGYPVEP